MILLTVATILFLHMCLIWAWYRIKNNPSVVDVGWASGITISGLIYLYSQTLTPRILFLSVILLLWGLRLGVYLWWTRIRQAKVDKRYLKLSEDWKIAKPLGYFLNFQLQGFLILIISLPWYFASLSAVVSPSILDCAAWIVALLAIMAETLADKQLQQFKQSNPGQVCNQGLWRYSRHPNYFFEWLSLCAFTIFAFQTSLGWLAMISPLTLYLIMTRVTAPMTERGSIQSRGQSYLEYQKITPQFFPVLKINQ